MYLWLFSELDEASSQHSCGGRGAGRQLNAVLVSINRVQVQSRDIGYEKGDEHKQSFESHVIDEVQISSFYAGVAA